VPILKLILVTGASSGVGAATVREFVKSGSKVILVARSADQIQSLANELGELAVAEPCDAADPKAVEAMAKRVLGKHGVPDIIVNCAGAGQWKTLLEAEPSEVITMMQAPYFAASFVTRAFLQGMLDRKSGVIINVNSPACLVPWRSSVGYAAARAALQGFHEALAQNLAGTGVRSCHAIFGKIDSPYFDNNPGVLNKMPMLAKTVPTLTPEACALQLARLAERPKHRIVFPWVLRIHIEVGRLFPGTTRWLARL
jgi:short-subunit dehydrogenase